MGRGVFPIPPLDVNCQVIFVVLRCQHILYKRGEVISDKYKNLKTFSSWKKKRERGHHGNFSMCIRGCGVPCSHIFISMAIFVKVKDVPSKMQKDHHSVLRTGGS